MKKKTMQTQLQTIVESPSVSGNEGVLVKYLAEEIDGQAKVWVDQKGNLICQKGESPGKLALVAHMDKEGWMVSGVAKDALEVVGTHKLQLFPGGVVSQVVVISEKDRVPGVLVNEGKSENKLKIYLEGAEKFSIGDFVMAKSSFLVNDKWISSAYLDNSMGVVAALEVLSKIKNGTVVFSALEEVGFAGIGLAVTQVKPEKVVVLDTTYDTQGDGAKLTAGNGPSICIKDKVFGDKKIIKDLIMIAKKKKIPYQVEIWEEANSDLNGLEDLHIGIPGCFVGLPIKFPGSFSQIGSLMDAERVVKLISSYFDYLWEKK